MSNTTDRRLERRAERCARKRETKALVEEHRIDLILDAEELAEIHREWNEWDATHRPEIAWPRDLWEYEGNWSSHGDPFDDFDRWYDEDGY